MKPLKLESQIRMSALWSYLVLFQINFIMNPVIAATHLCFSVSALLPSSSALSSSVHKNARVAGILSIKADVSLDGGEPTYCLLNVLPRPQFLRQMTANGVMDMTYWQCSKV